MVKKIADTIAPSFSQRFYERRYLGQAWNEIEIQAKNQNLDKYIDMVVGGGSRFGNVFSANQKRSEIEKLLELVRQLHAQRICEIGTSRGGTLLLFCQVAEQDAKLLTLDVLDMPERKKFYERFGKENQRVEAWHVDSHQQATVDRVRTWFQREPLDFLFIDGDHSEEGVTQDFNLYSPLVRKGGLIAFHDIHPDFKTSYGKPTGNDVGGVPIFWAKVKARYAEHYEFIDQTGQDGYGIGVLRVD